MAHEGGKLFPHSVTLAVTSAAPLMARMRPLLLTAAKLAEGGAKAANAEDGAAAEAAVEARFMLEGVNPEGEDFKVGQESTGGRCRSTYLNYA